MINLTDQELNVAIAKACGWYLATREEVKYPGQYPNGAWKHPDRGRWLFRAEDRGKVAGGFPCYTTDLNAMHEAEKTLTSTEQQNRYQAEIAEITWGCEETGHRQVVFNQLTATARQRAEAFYLTVCKPAA